MHRPVAYKSKAAFIREQGLEMPADEIIAAGKREGLKIKPQDVHNARFAAKKRATVAAVATTKPAKPNGHATKGKGKPKPPSVSPLELDFRKLAVRIGFDRAMDVLEELMTSVRV